MSIQSQVSKVETSTFKNIAVLIDADNASAKNIGQIINKIETFGIIGCKKIYGDWGSAHIQSWQEALLKYAIEPMQQFAYVKGKNATDIGMVIEAMDLLHSGDYDGFCLVSSDSDFTSLAVRIRKSNVKVFGFGKKNTVDAFTHACDGFFYVEDLVEEPKLTEGLSQHNESVASGPWTAQQLERQVHITQTIDKIINLDPKAINGWSNLSYIASQLSQNYNNINIEKFGFKKFSDFIIALRAYDIKRQENGMWAKQKQKREAASQASKHSPKNIENNKSQTKLTVDPKVNPELILSTDVSINISAAAGIDVVLYRLTDNNKVRGDEDMIFYGQTHSEDNSIEMHQYEEAEQSIVDFSCDLSSQPTEIEQLIYVLSSEQESMQSHTSYPIIKLTISDTVADKNIELYSKDFDMSDKSGKSLILFSIERKDEHWRIKPIHQSINSDLAQICEQYGVEISDD